MIFDQPRAIRYESDVTDHPLTFDDLQAMKHYQLRELLHRAHPVDPEAVAGNQYLGVDLSLP